MIGIDYYSSSSPAQPGAAAEQMPAAAAVAVA
jgi:hypothetical protein